MLQRRNDGPYYGAATENAAMARVTAFATDPNYIDGRNIEVTLDGRFFLGGLVLEADEGEGVITYIPTSEQGWLKFDSATGGWAKETVRGVVRLYMQEPGTRPC